MTTGQQVFELSMALIDEIQETGQISEGDTRGYKVRAPAILTMIEIELAQKEGLEVPDIITDLDKKLTISDYSARMIMPYGLSAHLMLEENPDSASFFNERYEELKRKIPSSFKPITSVYGVS